MALRIVFAALAVLWLAATDSWAGSEIIASFLEELSLPVPGPGALVVCHGFNCQYRTRIELTPADRLRLEALLKPGTASPDAERRGIANAVVWLDRRAGPLAGTTHRVALAGVHQSGDAGQMDCIDLSANNTSLFLLLEQLRLLHHHRVEIPVSRGMLIDGRTPHTTAVISEIKGGGKWAVDNWTHGYGAPPDVKPLEQWRNER